jgi:hypothetical protein
LEAGEKLHLSGGDWLAFSPCSKGVIPPYVMEAQQAKMRVFGMVVSL